MTLKSVEASAPTRIDLAGGTLDIWPLNLMFDDPVTLNMATDIRVHAKVRRRGDKKIVLISEDRGRMVEFAGADRMRHDHPLGMLSRIAGHFLDGSYGVEITTRSGAPAGAGLAGSSALNIALTAAMARLAGWKLSGEKLIATAKDIEAALLGVPTGLQDYGAAVHGGVSAFSYPPGGMRRESFGEAGQALARRVILFYSGKTRNSGVNNWEMFKRVLDRDRSATARFKKIARLAREAADALRAGDFERFDRVVMAEWEARRGLFPAISTPAIDRAVAAARRAGAGAARIMGAGGGGCFIVIADPARREAVTRAVERTGPVIKLPFALSNTGLRLYNTR